MSEQTPLLDSQPIPQVSPVLPTYTSQQPPAVVASPQAQIYLSPQNPLSDVPTRLTCPNCHQSVLTQLDYSSGALTWIIVLVLLLFGFAFPCIWFGCCLIPLCIKGVKDVKHICPNCGSLVGTYKRL